MKRIFELLKTLFTAIKCIYSSNLMLINRERMKTDRDFFFREERQKFPDQSNPLPRYFNLNSSTKPLIPLPLPFEPNVFLKKSSILYNYCKLILSGDNDQNLATFANIIDDPPVQISRTIDRYNNRSVLFSSDFPAERSSRRVHPSLSRLLHNYLRPSSLARC